MKSIHKILFAFIFVALVCYVGNIAGASEEKININAADAKTLATLPGIDKKRAVAIVAYRTKNAHFEFIEDIMSVPGISTEIFEGIKQLIKTSD